MDLRKENIHCKEKISGEKEEQPQTEIPEICEEIWKWVRNRLLGTYPLFRKLFLKLSFERSAQVKGWGTDGKTVYYQPEFLMKTFYDQPKRLEHDLLHMTYHVLFMHLMLAPEKDGKEKKLWDLACDMAAERLILQKREETHPAGIYEKLKEKNLTQTELEKLEAQYYADDHRMWADGDQKELTDWLEEFWSGITKSAGSGAGGMAGGIGRMKGLGLERMTLENRKKYEFRHFLRRFAVTREEVQTDMESFDYIPYLYGLERYGNMPLIEHLEYREMRKLEELVIAIDTSGSCSADMVRRFMEETYGILSDQENFFRKMKVYLIQCDCFIQDAVCVTCEEEWKSYMERLVIHGRSGTDFRPVFQYVEELRQKKELRDLKGLLYFTDGDGIYPEKPADYETAFVFYQEKERHQKVPPWAVKLVLSEETGKGTKETE